MSELFALDAGSSICTGNVLVTDYQVFELMKTRNKLEVWTGCSTVTSDFITLERVSGFFQRLISLQYFIRSRLLLSDCGRLDFNL